jgi:predicted TIM-barrel fold metal-dependent hydrolase
MTRIDAQVHIWSAEIPARSWPPGRAAWGHRPTPLGKDELPRAMDAAGVDRAIIVPLSWEGDRSDLTMAAALLHPQWISSPTLRQPE